MRPSTRRSTDRLGQGTLDRPAMLLKSSTQCSVRNVEQCGPSRNGVCGSLEGETAMFKGWSQGRALWRPTATRAMPIGSRRNVLLDGIGARPHAPTVHDNVFHGPLVVRLRQLVAPADIPRFVVAVVVEAFNAVFCRRSMADIGQEYREVMKPARADANASASIVFVRFARRLKTPLFYAGPHAIFSGLTQAVRRISAAKDLREDAAATTALAIAQAAGKDFFRAAAFTPTDPIATARRRASQHRPATIATPGQLNSCSHSLSELSIVYLGGVPSLREP